MVGALDGLDDAGEGGGVGEGAREEASGLGGREVEQGAGGGGEGEGQQEHGGDEGVVAQALAAQGGEEAGAAGEADGIDKQDEAQLHDELWELEGGVERASGEAHEQDSGDAEAGACDPDAAQRVAHGGDGEQEQQRVFLKDVEHRRGLGLEKKASGEPRGAFLPKARA